MKKNFQAPLHVADIRLGVDVYFDAWLYSMMMDNNLAWKMNPEFIASPEQMAFMVQLGVDQVYLPCSDATFVMLYTERMHGELQKYYNRAWRIIVRLIRSFIPERLERIRVLHFCRYRFAQHIAQRALIPSRLVKRMTNLVLAQSGLDDPWQEGRSASCRRQREMLELPEIKNNLDRMPRWKLPRDMERARLLLDNLELTRFLCLSAVARDWQKTLPSSREIRRMMLSAEKAVLRIREDVESRLSPSATILFLVDADGGIVFDLAMLQKLIRMGHRVICAVKAGFYFFSPTITDMETDETLMRWLRNGIVLRDQNLSKNDLLRYLREYRLMVISDGTRERLNLTRVSVTFSRAWKEADVILCKGWRAADILLGTSHGFTRDIICYWHDDEGFHVQYRKHAAAARKFNENDIMAQSDAIIEKMRRARLNSQPVMFYSCIIGSIPGQTAVAVALARAFVDNLRKKMDNIFIINPAEHFVEGMDGDDLMFMWERVQRSGYIDIWRFQTVKDIEKSFALLNTKVPPVWQGMDSTYSTGCTKEMRIALDVQAKNREMQIIGPEPRLFVRRSEYGVGKYFDAAFSRETSRDKGNAGAFKPGGKPAPR
ncbi:MAG: hypothetical protein LBC94_08095 [Desulfovibrio sp.]|jgi:uncharacterized protein with ATP-grasp and redox domains|nr:hypothetical protein [Desulfovibrio sp.]